jgi:hypothetical protein
VIWTRVGADNEIGFANGYVRGVYAMHQPFATTSPSIIAHTPLLLAEAVNILQLAQLFPSFGLSWYEKSRLSALEAAQTRCVVGRPTQAAAHTSCIAHRRFWRRSSDRGIFFIATPLLQALQSQRKLYLRT